MRVTEKVRKQLVQAVKKDGVGTLFLGLYDEALTKLHKMKPEDLNIKKRQTVRMATVNFHGKDYLVCLVESEDGKNVWTFQEIYEDTSYYGIVETKGKWRGYTVED